MVLTTQVKTLRPYLKNHYKVKKDGRVAQVVECLPSKHKAKFKYQHCQKINPM
jgi:hypothetical protein